MTNDACRVVKRDNRTSSGKKRKGRWGKVKKGVQD